VLNRRTQKGFSLIELMIAVAIIAIVSAIAFPSYRAWIQNTKIRTTAESILNGLQIARAEAVRRNSKVQFQFALGANSWTVGCYAPVAGCPAIIQSRSTAEGSSSAITVTTMPTAANTTVVFNNLGTVDPAPAPFCRVEVDVPTSVLAAAESRNLRVTLGVGGNARMCDPDAGLSSTDPRKCPALAPPCP
jgi:type IV fimbrial biogenesis protein FimT